MWAVRILTGQQAGQVFPMKPGKFVLGRGPTCEIKINSNSVSKEHASILVTEDGKVIVTDLNSRNGTFVNGVKVQNQRISHGDKISVHEVIVDLVQIPDHANVATFQGARPRGPSQGAMQPSAPMPAWAGNAALRMQQQVQQQAEAMAHAQMAHQQMPHAPQPPPQMKAGSLGDVFGNFRIYIDTVAMPGVYTLVQSMPYRFALVLMLLLYVVAVTSISIVPMVSTTQKNIQAESVRRARSIARNVRDVYKRSVQERMDPTNLDFDTARREEGVTDVFIINAKDGTVLAPANLRGEFAKKPFVNKARHEEREFYEFVDSTTLGVSVPIVSYSAETGQQSVVAYSMVLYDSGSMALNGGQTISLFIQTLAIAMAAGLLLYFFLARVVEHPIELLNGQLDDALREGRDDLQTPYQFPQLERLVSNVNSALSRMDQGGGGGPAASMMSKDVEASNIVGMLPTAAIAINAIDERIVTSNLPFDRLVGGNVMLQGRPLNAIPDPALPLKLQELLGNLRSNPMSVATSTLRFPEGAYTISGQAVMGGNDPAYYLFTLAPGGDS